MSCVKKQPSKHSNTTCSTRNSLTTTNIKKHSPFRNNEEKLILSCCRVVGRSRMDLLILFHQYNNTLVSVNLFANLCEISSPIFVNKCGTFGVATDTFARRQRTYCRLATRLARSADDRTYRAANLTWPWRCQLCKPKQSYRQIVSSCAGVRVKFCSLNRVFRPRSQSKESSLTLCFGTLAGSGLFTSIQL